MGGLIDIEQKGWVSVIHDHDHDRLVTKVRCKDLPDSDRGDFLNEDILNTYENI